MNNRKTFAVRLDADTIGELSLAAQMEQSNVSSIIRKAIDAYLFNIGGDLELYIEQRAALRRALNWYDELREREGIEGCPYSDTYGER